MEEFKWTAKKVDRWKIGFIGLGKLGMPCAEACVRKGLDVTGFDTADTSSQLVDIKKTIKDAVQDRDIIFVAVPTPHEHGYDGREPTSEKEVKDFDYTTVKSVIETLNDLCRRDQIVVLISTVLPGTCRRILSQLCLKTGLVYNPYLIAMGTVAHDMINPEMIMIGTEKGWEGQRCGYKMQVLTKFYKTLCDNDPRVETGTWEETEAMKIFYNTFISNKIALVNMIQDVAHKLGHMNVDNVTEALSRSTKRIISPAYMKAGMGDGGACHPRDNIALRWLARELNLGYDMFESIMTAREKQAETMARAILKHGNNIFFSSDSYKPGTTLIDGSYSLLVQYFVKKHGGQLANGIDTPVEVIVRVHESDQFTCDEKTIVFDPWRTYPKAENVVYYGAPQDPAHTSSH
jgi:UDPglucose 6-dehydrogenase